MNTSLLIVAAISWLVLGFISERIANLALELRTPRYGYIIAAILGPITTILIWGTLEAKDR